MGGVVMQERQARQQTEEKAVLPRPIDKESRKSPRPGKELNLEEPVPAQEAAKLPKLERPLKISSVSGEISFSFDPKEDLQAFQKMTQLRREGFSFQTFDEKDGHLKIRAFHNGKFLVSIQTDQTDINPGSGRLDPDRIANGLEKLSKDALRTGKAHQLLLIDPNAQGQDKYVVVDPKTHPELHNTLSYLASEHEIRYENASCVGYDKEGNKAFTLDLEKGVITMSNGDYILPHASHSSAETTVKKGSPLYSTIENRLQGGEHVHLRGNGKAGEPVLLEFSREGQTTLQLYAKSGVVADDRGSCHVPNDAGNSYVTLDSRYDKQLINAVNQCLQQGYMVTVREDKDAGTASVIGLDEHGKEQLKLSAAKGPLTSERLQWANTPKAQRLKQSFENLEKVASLLEQGGKGADVSRQIALTLVGTDSTSLLAHCDVRIQMTLMQKHGITPYLGSFLMPDGKTIQYGSDFEKNLPQMKARYGEGAVELMELYALNDIVQNGVIHSQLTSLVSPAQRREYLAEHGKALRQVLDGYARVLAAEGLAQQK